MELYEPRRELELSQSVWLTHLILLYIHEAGHLFFAIFGNTVMILGGSLMQLLAPLSWHILATREGSTLSNAALIFTGISIIDVSIYIKDAAVMQLPLIGGLSKAHHDWSNLLRRWDLIEWSFGLGEIFFWFGLSVALYGFGNRIHLIVREFREKGATV